MWRLFSLLVFLVLIFAVVGYFRGWLHVGTNENAGQTHINVNVDNQKAERDAHKAEQKFKQEVHRIEGEVNHPPQPAAK